MKNYDLLEAIGNVNDECVKKAKEKKKSKPVWYKWGAIAACFLLVVCIGVIALPQLLEQGEVPPGEDADYVHAVIIGDFIYSPFYSTDYERFPEVHHLIKNAPSGNITYIEFDIKEEHLGEYIGIVPANKKVHRSEGKAYRLAEYPNYDAIIIVDFDGKYELYVGAPNDVDKPAKKSQ